MYSNTIKHYSCILAKLNTSHALGDLSGHNFTKQQQGTFRYPKAKSTRLEVLSQNPNRGIGCIFLCLYYVKGRSWKQEQALSILQIVSTTVDMLSKCRSCRKANIL